MSESVGVASSQTLEVDTGVDVVLNKPEGVVSTGSEDKVVGVIIGLEIEGTVCMTLEVKGK